MKRILFAFLMMVASCTDPGSDSKNQDARPVKTIPQPPRVKNAVLITIDTLRADVLGTYGGSAQTPVLDGLARRGWTFERCFSASMLTNPSHASIMTSLYSRDHGVYDNESGIADGVRTLAMAMDRQGFRTAAVINFPHLNPEVANLGTGFQRIIPATRNERGAAEMSAQALTLIDEFDSNENFFMWLHYTDPHAPYEPPQGFEPREPSTDKRTPLSVAARAAPGFQKKNPWFKKAFREYGSVEELKQRYIAEVEATDAGLQIFLDGLKKRGLFDQTALFITSDHGENLGEHELYFHHGGLYRETVHVPLILAIPGISPARVAGLVETVDIAPTLLELTGAPRWEPMRGRSLVGVVQRHEPTRSYVFSEHMWAQQVSVRGLNGTYVLHRKSTRQFPTYHFVAGRTETYDLMRDPQEKESLSREEPITSELDAALQGYLQTGLSLAARPAINQDRESLRALGYIE